MIGPNLWRDEGPASGTRGFAVSGTPAIGARNVGHMIPDASVVPTPQARAGGGARRPAIAGLGARRWNGEPR